MLTFQIYGRDYRVPAALEPEPALCEAFHAAVQSQLEAAATAAGLPKTTVQVAQFAAPGVLAYDEKGTVKTMDVAVWTSLPDALHDAITVPTAEDVLSPPAATSPAVPVMTPAPEED